MRSQSLTLAVLMTFASCGAEEDLDDAFTGINPYSEYCPEYQGCLYAKFNDATIRTWGGDWSTGEYREGWYNKHSVGCDDSPYYALLPYFALKRSASDWDTEFDDYINYWTTIHGPAEQRKGNDVWGDRMDKLIAMGILPDIKQELKTSWYERKARYGYHTEATVTALEVDKSLVGLALTGGEYVRGSLLALAGVLNLDAKKKVLDENGVPQGDYIVSECGNWLVAQVPGSVTELGLICSDLIDFSGARLPEAQCPGAIGYALWGISDNSGNDWGTGEYYSGADQACGTGTFTFRAPADHTGTIDVTGATCYHYAADQTADGVEQVRCDVANPPSGTHSIPLTVSLGDRSLETTMHTICP